MTTAAQPVPTTYAQPTGAADRVLPREGLNVSAAAGTYAFQWEMVQDGVEHFGDFTPLVSVQVGASEVGTPDGLLTALWDNDNLLLELDAALTVTGRYTGTPDAWGGLISQWQQAQLVDRWNSPSSSFYAFDSQGSTRVLTNPAGAVTDASAYRAFGAAWQGGNGSANAYRYAGEYGYYRDSAAVQYVRARYLNVLQGRWMSAKPANRQRGHNPYAYGQNRPHSKAHLLDGLDIPICAIPCVPCSACLIDAFLVCRDCKLDLKCWARCLLGVWKNLPAWVKIGCGIACGACVFCLTEDVCGTSLTPLAAHRKPKHPGNSPCLAKMVACTALCSRCSDPLCCGGDFGVCCYKFCTDSFHRCLVGKSCNDFESTCAYWCTNKGSLPECIFPMEIIW